MMNPFWVTAIWGRNDALVAFPELLQKQVFDDDVSHVMELAMHRRAPQCQLCSQCQRRPATPRRWAFWWIEVTNPTEWGVYCKSASTWFDPIIPNPIFTPTFPIPNLWLTKHTDLARVEERNSWCIWCLGSSHVPQTLHQRQERQTATSLKETTRKASVYLVYWK